MIVPLRVKGQSFKENLVHVAVSNLWIRMGEGGGGVGAGYPHNIFLISL